VDYLSILVGNNWNLILMTFKKTLIINY
jgi:hypothetical protein